MCIQGLLHLGWIPKPRVSYELRGTFRCKMRPTQKRNSVIESDALHGLLGGLLGLKYP